MLKIIDIPNFSMDAIRARVNTWVAQHGSMAGSGTLLNLTDDEMTALLNGGRTHNGYLVQPRMEAACSNALDQEEANAIYTVLIDATKASDMSRDRFLMKTLYSLERPEVYELATLLSRYTVLHMPLDKPYHLSYSTEDRSEVRDDIQDRVNCQLRAIWHRFHEPAHSPRTVRQDTTTSFGLG